MSNAEEMKEEPIQFSWGKKRGVGSKKGIQFYESFVYDGMEYFLYDCVYLFKDGVSQPYVGKLVKIWEQPVNKKRVKVLWFFRPNEIHKYLGNDVPQKNEIFLATGEGVGLFNVNPLEAVAGKCNVICTSKDDRNLQPSSEELKLADFIFYRTFNVGSYTISDKIEDAIAGVEARLLLNRQEQKPSAVFKIKTGEIDGHVLKDKTTEGSQDKIPSNEKIVQRETYSGQEALDANNVSAAHNEEKRRPGKDVTLGESCDDEPSKKMRVSDNLTKSSDDRKKAKTGMPPKIDSNDEQASTVVSKTSEDKSKIRTGKDSLGMDKRAGILNLDETQKKLYDGSLRKGSPGLSMGTDGKAGNDIVEVARRPETDRSKWFGDLPWDTKMESACDQGRLVMLGNLDPDYAQAEIEDILYHTFEQNCSVRLIEQSTFTNPHYGQALVIFKSSDAANLAVEKLNTEILMLPNGRPLLASKGITRSLEKKSSELIGLQSIDKYTKLKKQREEMRKAASASHYSQPNTLEYEMAMEWMFLEDRARCWWEELHEVNRRELKLIKSKLKTK